MARMAGGLLIGITSVITFAGAARGVSLDRLIVTILLLCSLVTSWNEKTRTFI